jgi:hypothetical protein
MAVVEEIKVAEDIRKLSRAWAAAEQGGGSLNEVVRDLNDTRERIRKFRETVLADLPISAVSETVSLLARV